MICPGDAYYLAANASFWSRPHGSIIIVISACQNIRSSLKIGFIRFDHSDISFNTSYAFDNDPFPGWTKL